MDKGSATLFKRIDEFTRHGVHVTSPHRNININVLLDIKQKCVHYNWSKFLQLCWSSDLTVKNSDVTVLNSKFNVWKSDFQNSDQTVRNSDILMHKFDLTRLK